MEIIVKGMPGDRCKAIYNGNGIDIEWEAENLHKAVYGLIKRNPDTFGILVRQIKEPEKIDELGYVKEGTVTLKHLDEAMEIVFDKLNEMVREVNELKEK